MTDNTIVAAIGCSHRFSNDCIFTVFTVIQGCHYNMFLSFYGHDKRSANFQKWRIALSDERSCGQLQTMNQIVDSCPLMMSC